MEARIAKVHTNGASLIIILPQKFVRRHGIKKGDEVGILYDGFLQVIPHKDLANEEKKE